MTGLNGSASPAPPRSTINLLLPEALCNRNRCRTVSSSSARLRALRSRGDSGDGGGATGCCRGTVHRPGGRGAGAESAVIMGGRTSGLEDPDPALGSRRRLSSERSCRRRSRAVAPGYLRSPGASGRRPREWVVGAGLEVDVVRGRRLDAVDDAPPREACRESD